MSGVRTAVIVPALNKEASLPEVLRALRGDPRVVVADNGSTDGTAAVARRAGAEVVWVPRRGYGSAVLAGIAHLRASPPEVLVIVDADAADPVDRWPLLVDPIALGVADLVSSDRTALAEPGALTFTQRFGNALATRLIAAATGHQYADMGPFRAIRWSALERLGMSDPTWGWNVEMQVKAVRAGLRVVEIELPYRRRERGRSKVSGSVRGSARAGARILWAVQHYARAPQGAHGDARPGVVGAAVRRRVRAHGVRRPPGLARLAVVAAARPVAAGGACRVAHGDGAAPRLRGAPGGGPAGGVGGADALPP